MLREACVGCELLTAVTVLRNCSLSDCRWGPGALLIAFRWCRMRALMLRIESLIAVHSLTPAFIVVTHLLLNDVNVAHAQQSKNIPGHLPLRTMLKKYLAIKLLLLLIYAMFNNSSTWAFLIVSRLEVPGQHIDLSFRWNIAQISPCA